MSSTSKKDGLMHRLAETVVDKRNLIFILIVIGIVFSAFSIGWVEVENDLTAFLPANSESKKGVDIMNKEFVTYGTAQVMVANVTYEDAEKILEQINEIENIAMVEFDSTEAHYKDSMAYYSVTFGHPQTDERCVAALRSIESALSSYDLYVYSEVGNPLGDILNEEIFMILIVASIMILVMLLVTSKTFAEVPIILITFMVAMILNMGTNFVFGKISFVSNSVTSLLQLALSLDYAVILINRYKEERQLLPKREAVIEALSGAVPEVFGSSLTTVGGMAAMLFMQFLLGPDMAICLIKAIIFAMLSVFFFMPGFLVVCGDLMKKTEHKSLIPDVSFIGKFAYKTRKVVPPMFAVLIVVAMIVSSNCPYSYAYFDQESAKENEQSIAKRLISENFGSSNMIALIVPKGDYEAEKKLLADISACDGVKSAMGLANTEAIDGYTLADKLTPRQFAELADIDYEIGVAIYTAYAAGQESYGEIVNNIADYGVPLIDMFLFVSEILNSDIISLEGEQAEMLATAGGLMKSAKELLTGTNHNRMIIYVDLPEEGEEAFGFIDRLRDMAEGYYPDSEIYMVGNITSSRDFKISFETDNAVVTIISIAIVFLVLLFAFKSIAMPILLILVIQGAIWVNFSIPTILNTPLFFLGYLIISAIQMGANIDYAIVIASRYNELKKEYEPREAIIETMNFAFPTVITSGAIMAVSGLLIGYMSSVPVISLMGSNLGRGTIVSVIMVLFLLPQLLLVTDKLVDKTTFTIAKKANQKKTGIGRVRVNGRVDGEINGRIIGVIDAVIEGDVNLSLHSAKITDEEEELNDENN